MNKTYFIIRSEGLGHEMYYRWGVGRSGARWTFKIAEAVWWGTDGRPKVIAANENSTSVNVISITETEYFKRVLAGK